MPHVLRGIALKLAATFVFSLMYVAIRLAQPAPLGEVMFFRGFIALVPLAIVSFLTHGPQSLVRTNHPWLHLRRSLAGTASMFLNFAAVTRLPLADITAFSFVAPVFATVLAALLLHEQVGPHRAAAVVAGFGGVLLMTAPHGFPGMAVASGPSLGAAFAVSGALLSALVVIFIRQMSGTERSEAIVFYFMLVCAAFGAIAMLWEHVSYAPATLFWLTLTGIFGGIGQICMTYSYRYAEPSLLAPFDYTALIWAMTFGYVVFAEVPERIVLGGAAVVSAAGLYIVWRERLRNLPVAQTPGL
ncbi:MAG TPA: DMT family transporter [Rhizomicrobium sp.]|nr:DMT family transporter [Rhizomicrobium sp.]